MTETQLKQHPVILTRTGAVNQRLALRFSKLGFRTFAWPAFTIRLPERSCCGAGYSSPGPRLIPSRDWARRAFPC